MPWFFLQEEKAGSGKGTLCRVPGCIGNHFTRDHRRLVGKTNKATPLYHYAEGKLMFLLRDLRFPLYRNSMLYHLGKGAEAASTEAASSSAALLLGAHHFDNKEAVLAKREFKRAADMGCFIGRWNYGGINHTVVEDATGLVPSATLDGKARDVEQIFQELQRFKQFSQHI